MLVTHFAILAGKKPRVANNWFAVFCYVFAVVIHPFATGTFVNGG